jgi:NTE family protein
VLSGNEVVLSTGDPVAAVLASAAIPGIFPSVTIDGRSAVASAVHALTLLIEQRLVLDVAAYHGQVELIVLPPLCPLSVSSVDFRSARLLIERRPAEDAA